MDVCRECCVLSGGGHYDELITRPEESYRLWCVVVCGLFVNFVNEEALAHWGMSRQKEEKFFCCYCHTADSVSAWLIYLQLSGNVYRKKNVERLTKYDKVFVIFRLS